MQLHIYFVSWSDTADLPRPLTLYYNSVVAISTFNEASTGVYDITFVAQDVSDVLELRQASTGDKYDKEGFELVVPSITIV